MTMNGNYPILRVMLVSILTLFVTSIFAQSESVSGNVKDNTGEPVIGATVRVKGSTTATVTDIDGNFVISCLPDAVLEINYIGFNKQEQKVDGKKVLTFFLVPTPTDLDEIVVVGYGVQKKSSMTASVASVNVKDINKQVTSNVASALIGRTPGVEVLQNGGQAGGDVSVIIRGAASFGSTEPLYIIDGAFSANGLNSLNPNDIQSIEILKDGSAAAIYGSRAANGVVLVTTKHGTSGEPKIEITGNYTFQKLSKKLNFMNAEQWRQFANEVADNSPKYARAPQNVNPTDPSFSQDWQDLYYETSAKPPFIDKFPFSCVWKHVPTHILR